MPLVIDASNKGVIWVDGDLMEQSALPDVLKTLRKSKPKRPVIIRGTNDVRHEYIHDAMDTCSDAGYPHIVLAGPHDTVTTLNPTWLAPTEDGSQRQYQRRAQIAIDNGGDLSWQPRWTIVVYIKGFIVNGKPPEASPPQPRSDPVLRWAQTVVSRQSWERRLPSTRRLCRHLDPAGNR